MSDRDTVRCRAQIDPRCEDGTLLKHWTEDGTYDGDTVVCTWCYWGCVRASGSGVGLLDELPETVARLQRDGLR